jgi:hypothetical protein
MSFGQKMPKMFGVRKYDYKTTCETNKDMNVIGLVDQMSATVRMRRTVSKSKTYHHKQNSTAPMDLLVKDLERQKEREMKAMIQDFHSKQLVIERFFTLPRRGSAPPRTNVHRKQSDRSFISSKNRSHSLPHIRVQCSHQSGISPFETAFAKELIRDLLSCGVSE